MMPQTHPQLDARQRRQIGLITFAALAIFAFLRWLPTGTTLSHMDFRVDSPNSIEFCDPSSPQFIPVVAVASPVALTLKSSPARAGESVRVAVMLQTSNGKPIEIRDLLVVHTRRLHLLITDPSLQDYQHVHPEPTEVPGEWSFEFTPRAAGAYRVFADFTPAATNRGLYANADLNVEPSSSAAVLPAFAPASNAVPGYAIELVPSLSPLRAKVPVDLKLKITRADGATVPLEPVMDAYAHLVAFDRTRSGFAHLHPMQNDPTQPPDRVRPELDFKITIPSPGRYVVWAQVNLAGRETFVPFWFDVEA